MKPTLALVSTIIRRDLLAPLVHFRAVRLVHLYRRADYGDLTEADRDESLQLYTSPFDLYRRLVQARPAAIQGVEPISFAQQPYLWAGYLAARRTGARRIVVTLENRPLDAKFGHALAGVMRLLLRLYCAGACLIVAVNDGARRNLLSAGVRAEKIERLMWGTWGVELDEFTPPYAPPPGPPVILYAGRLAAEKGLDTLLEAFPRVRAALPQARLVIVGDGPLRLAVEEKARTLDGVTLTGAVKNREMPRLLAGAHVLAMPSRTTRGWEEQVGMVALQALACGVPVVASHSGAIPEFIPDGEVGRLVHENDPVALAGALVQTLSDENRWLEWSRNARVLACARYDARANVARAEQRVLEACLAGRI